jgi:hypothetical protein
MMGHRKSEAQQGRTDQLHVAQRSADEDFALGEIGSPEPDELFAEMRAWPVPGAAGTERSWDDPDLQPIAQRSSSIACCASCANAS